jgi:hypothetical protein
VCELGTWGLITTYSCPKKYLQPLRVSAEKALMNLKIKWLPNVLIIIIGSY